MLRRGYAASASAPPFDWQDPLNVKSLLTEEELAISETAEKYCQEQLLPRVLRMIILLAPFSQLCLCLRVCVLSEPLADKPPTRPVYRSLS